LSGGTPGFARQDELQKFMNEVVSRKFETDSAADKVIFFLGRLAVEDYVEVLLNAGNGYGIAALKLLRAMAERLITMMYLIRNPDKVPDFLDYEYVHQRKIVNHIKAAGADPRNLSTRMRHGVREFTVAGSAHCSRRTGSVNVNVEPCPTWLFTQIRPPVELDELPGERQPEPRPLDLLVRRPHLPVLFEVWVRASWTEAWRSENAGRCAGQRQVGFVP
jgi:hypothetical protein